MSQIRIQVGEVPKFPFVGYPVELSVQLIKENRLVCGERVPIKIKLLVNEEEGTSVCNSDIMQVEGGLDGLHVPESGSAMFHISILEPSMRHENKEFSFEISVASDRYQVAPTVTGGMFVVSHQLKIETTVPSLFYKDLGGKDSCVEFDVSLRDQQNEVVRDRRVVLKPRLLYENGKEVPDQEQTEILTVVGDHRQLSMDRGVTHLKLRINEVSRNHQKQNFVIKVCADTLSHPLMNDIAPDLTTPIDVMSKPRPSKAGGGAAGGGGVKRSAPVSDSAEESQHKAARILETGSSVGPPSRTDVDAILGNLPVCNQEMAADIFNGLMSWARMTIEEVSHLQWRQVGYETVGDGSMPSQPLFERRNPNAAITELINKYNEFALPSLALLHRDIFSQRSHTSTTGQSSHASHQERGVTGGLTEEAVQRLYGNGSSVSRPNSVGGPSGGGTGTGGGGDFDEEDLGGMMPPTLTAQHSLISLPDDWPTLDRVLTSDLSSLLPDSMGNP